MSRRIQLLIIILAVVVIAAIVSHSVISWLKIETTFGGHWLLEPEGNQLSVFLSGSSLAGDGLSWRRISDELKLKIEGWGVAGSSPSEWEQFQSLATQANLTIIVVSVYDLNEHFLSDFRADIVPLEQTIKDLWQIQANWSYGKNLLSMYPLSYLRMAFPTAGRSDGVMVGVREKLNTLAYAGFSIESEAGPTMALNNSTSAQDYKKESITNWPSAKTLRRLAALRSGSQGKHEFNGPKKLAFFRMLHQAQMQGHALVVVLPVSPVYEKEFLIPETRQKFEGALTDIRNSMPAVHWVRIDQVKELNSNEYFWDLVHMNPDGQKIATEAFLHQIGNFISIQ
jgi:hypothetical protein